MAEYCKHLQDIALFIPDLYDSAGIQLLIIMNLVYAELKLFWIDVMEKRDFHVVRINGYG